MTVVEGTPVQRHAQFYWDFTAFQVENTLFKVPKGPFIDGSSFFRDMYSVPQASVVQEGTDDEHPIHLPVDSVSSDEFAVLVKALCSPGSSISNTDRLSDFSDDDWICCLKLSTMWDFADLRNVSIGRLSTREIVRTDEPRKLALGVQYQVPKWIREAVEAFVKRPQLVLTKEEKGLIGSQALLHILEIREGVRVDWEERWKAGTCCRVHQASVSRRVSSDVLAFDTRFTCYHCGTFDMHDRSTTKSLIRRIVEERFPESKDVDNIAA